MTLRERLYRWLFAAEHVAHEKLKADYIENVKDHVRYCAKREQEYKQAQEEIHLMDSHVKAYLARILELERQVSNQGKELEIVRAQKIVRPPGKPARFDRYRAMDDEQLTEVLAGSAALPQVKAIMEMIDTKFQQSSDAASEPKLEYGETKFHLGGADWLIKLKAELQALLEQERKEEVKA